MSDKKNIYITTTLPYVNSDPHIGFALELVHADVLARLYRTLGHSVFFNTGTDEHGQKIFNKAVESGMDVQDYVDQYAKRFEGLQEILNISNDAFIRTTSNSHIKSAQALWKISEDNGDIYKKKYSGLYCVGCEAFVLESDLVNGECQNHPGVKPQFIEEENYFFRLSKYQDQLLKYLEDARSAVPDFRRNEALEFVKKGLEDLSISRLKSKMSWGIDVPGDNEHVMYVWFDALSNYISTLGWPSSAKATEGKPDESGNFKKFWEEAHTIQLAGKDQVRFQSIIWQAMLFSIGEHNTDEISYHGFITSGGQKMSKSIGNVINPFDVQAEYGTDALRYYLLRHIHPFDDSDFTDEKFKESYNAHLANGLGNLTSRIMKMVLDYELGYDELHTKEEIWNHQETVPYIEFLKKFEFNHALDMVWDAIKETDELIAREQPFKVIKENPDQAKKVLRQALINLHNISVLLEPILPETSLKIQKAIENKEKPESLFVRK